MELSQFALLAGALIWIGFALGIIAVEVNKIREHLERGEHRESNDA